MSNKHGSYRHGASTSQRNINDAATVSKGSRPVKQMAAPAAVTSTVRAVRTSGGADKSPPASSRNFVERLPSEILIKILSYLDASALFSIGHVSKLFYRVANDDALWLKIHAAEFGTREKEKRKRFDEVLPKMAEVQDRAAGYCKWLYFRTVDARELKNWRRHLGLISCYTGLPSETEQVLRKLRVTWELTVSDKTGQESTHEASWTRFSETSVTLCWSGGGCLSNYQQISTLQLHGVRRIALNCPGLKKPGWRSLVVKLDMKTLAKSTQVIGQDRLVELKLLQPGIIIGMWKDQRSVAFAMFTLHFHGLAEKSIQGSSVCPYVEPTAKPPFDDIDPEYGLHGYQLHFALHDTVCRIMSASFSQLFCRRTQMCDGLIQLTAIDRTDLSQHVSLLGSITLPWRCEALQGTVQNCCIMDLTLMDEFRKPFWCVSSPVSMIAEESHVTYDYDGDHFLIHYEDPEGQVKMKLVWMMEQHQFVLLSLVIYVPVCKVNKHFSKDY